MKSLQEQALEHIPGGVNSPVRSCLSVNASPIYFTHANGAYLYTEDNQPFIDFVCGWGAHLHGHNHPNIQEAIQRQSQQVINTGCTHPIEIQYAKKLSSFFKHVDQVRCMNSGTEVTMTAIRLARGITQKSIIIKFDGCYHGHSDSLLVEAGSGVATLNLPSSSGIPVEITSKTISIPFNDEEAVKNVFKSHGAEIAAVIVEPIAGNMNCIPGKQSFLALLREITTSHGALLIFDEVMTGLRVHISSAQGLYDISPDLTCLGKIIGGGLPCGALAGKKELMAHLAPEGNVYQAGTLSGNPITLSAGLAAINMINENQYKNLQERTEQLHKGLLNLSQKYTIPLTVQSTTGMLGIFFTDSPEITNYQQAKNCNLKAFSYFYHELRKHHIHIAPSAFEVIFISLQHTEKDIENFLKASDAIFSNFPN